MSASAIIIGSEGQDGTLIKMHLHSKGYKIYGVGRVPKADLEYLDEYVQFDLGADDYGIITNLIVRVRPTEIYYIAAFHQSSQEKSIEDHLYFAEQSIKVNQLGFIKILEILNQHARQTKIFYASSSLIYAGCNNLIQTEDTRPAPRCIYSVSKSAAMQAAEYYRTKELFVSVGILYNHESIFRKDGFLSKKIINETKELVSGKRSLIKIGDLSSVTDWGYAPDYVDAMHHILQLDEPDIFIISSGEGHTVQNWFEVLFDYIKLDWPQYVVEDRSLLTRSKPTLIGDNNKLLATGWNPQTSFSEMVIRMYNNQL